MKVFLSHKMHGVSEEEIMKLREETTELIKARYPDHKIEIIDNYHHDDAPKGVGRLWHLGRSIQMMDEADLVVFCPDGGGANGVLVEDRVCRVYGIPCIYLYGGKFYNT